MAIILFQKVRYKNFLSTGNTFTEVTLNEDSSTLVQGLNGSGKSTILDSLCFSLFGRAFRSINKPQIINSINKKDCVVELFFKIGEKQYKIIRGLKPSIFEIYCDDVLINQVSDSRDYQVILEQQILKMNFKVFTQIVVLGSSSYIPFMKLNAGARREVVDEILSVRVFTDMGEVHKQKIKATKEQLKEQDAIITNLRTKAEGQKRLIQALKQKAQEGTTILEGKISRLLTEISTETSALEELTKKEVPLEDVDVKELNETLLELSKQIFSKEQEISSLKKTLSFYEEHDICPTCSSELKNKDSIVEKTTKDKETIAAEVTALAEMETGLSAKYDAATKIIKQQNTLKNEINAQAVVISSLNRQLISLNEELSNYNSDSSEIDNEVVVFDGIVKDGKAAAAKKNEVSALSDIQEIVSLLLKDSGIKTILVAEYLPAINSLINKYLSEMDFFVKFELDEQFAESIKSRHRDEFSYMCFSEGERMRIDLAIMFAFRQIAKMKSSVNTNLLFMDEILDGTLDASGVEFVLNFISEQEYSNIFLISHKDNVADRFERVVKFVKRGDFSVVEN